MSDATTPVDADRLNAFCRSALERLGVPSDQAATIADSLVDANLQGIDSHGIVRLPQYAGRIRGGGLRPTTELVTIVDRPSVVVIDANDGFGQVAATAAMGRAIERAKDRGIAAAAVRRSNHVGVMGYYSRMAVEHGMIGFAVSGAAPGIAPWGGAEALLGSNPWSIAYPTRGEPLVVDIANGVVIAGKLRAAEQRGETIPLGWALDQDGRPTQDPAAGLAGSLLPFGGAKGAGLTLAWEVLASVLTGASFSRDVPELTNPVVPQRLGHLFLAIRVEDFMPLDEFVERIDRLLAAIESSRPVAGGPTVRIPGRRGAWSRAERRTSGVPLPAGLRATLASLGGELGIEPPW